MNYKNNFVFFLNSILVNKCFQIAFLVIISQNAIAQNLSRFEFSERKMGTQFRLIFYCKNDSLATEISQKVFEKIENLNLIFSDYNPESEVSQISEKAGSGEKIRVSTDLWEVLRFSKKLSKKSRGAFDVSIGPLSKLWRKAFRQQQFPKLSEIEAAQSLVNFRWIKMYPKSQRVRLKKVGMRLDFGGIAKGYAVDEAMKVLKNNGIEIALIDGGGDILANQPPPNADFWEVKIDGGNVLEIKEKAIATSGDKYQFLEWQGKKYSHIIHPKTGFGISEKRQFSVEAENCMVADALASAGILVSDKKFETLKKQFKLYQ